MESVKSQQTTISLDENRVGAIVQLLEEWVQRHSDSHAYTWYRDQKHRLSASPSVPDRTFFLSISQTGRRIGKLDLQLNSHDFQRADDCRPGWNPVGWSVDQAARLALLLGTTTPDAFPARLEKLCRSADISEMLTYYRGLPLYPDQPHYFFRATEGLRSNIRPVFESVAHYNPYPFEQFDENSWNHMVLKAIFIGSSLAPMVGFEARTNLHLARMLCHYAHERWAARRTVNPELWRAVGPFAHAVDGAMDDFRKLLDTGSELDQEAARLALLSCSERQMVESLPGFNSSIPVAHTWNDIAISWKNLQ